MPSLQAAGGWSPTSNCRDGPAPGSLRGRSSRFFRPFAVTLDLADRHPWESMATHMKKVTMSERYFGSAYIATGVA